MSRNSAIVLVLIGILSLAWVIFDTILEHRDKTHIDWMCGTITSLDGTREPVKISIENEMSFDLRNNPGLINLYRCEKDTLFSSIR